MNNKSKDNKISHLLSTPKDKIIKDKLNLLQHKLKEKADSDQELIEWKEELENIIKDSIGGIIINESIEGKDLDKGVVKISGKVFHDLKNISKIGVIVYNTEYRITDINEVMIQILGYKRDELIGMHKSQLYVGKNRMKEMNPSRFDVILQSQLDKLGKDQHYPRKAILIGKENIAIPVQQYATLLKDTSGKVVGAVFLSNDLRHQERLEKEIKEIESFLENHIPAFVTAEIDRSVKKKLEEDLRETKDFLENIFETSVEGILITSGSGNIIRSNTAFKKLTGYEEKNIRDKHVIEMYPFEGEYTLITGGKIFIDENYHKESAKMLEKMFETGKISSRVDYLVSKNGKLIPVETNAALLRGKNGIYIGTISSFRDLTERKKAELELKRAYSELQEAKEYLENIFSTSADGIVIADPKGMITNVNEAVEKMLGYSKEELIGKYVTELVPKKKGYVEKGKGSERKFFEEGRIIGEELTWMRKDGKLVDIEINSGLLKDKKGNIIGSVASVRDITERKEMEEKFFQSEKLKSLGELAGGVAHDFNNVLAAILGRAQLLKMRIEPPQGKQERRRFMLELKKGLEIIEKASLDGAETVRRIQEFSQERADDKDFTQVDINELIKHTLEFTQVRWKDEAESKGIKIRIRKEFSSLPPIAGNASQLREVFTNLINNAIDVMPHGGQIKIKTFKKDKRIYITIEDTGIGITKAIKDRIFDPFFTTKGVKFSGLGLSVSYGIINLHRGDIKVDSVDGKGTTFTITIPISGKRVKEEVKSIPTEQRKASILVIEDDEDVRQLLSDILIMGGHEVEIAAGGIQGIKLFKKKDFDLVFTDLGMPEMSGWQVAEEVKRIDDKTPVVLITGWQVQLKQSEMKESGVDFIINKPFQMDQILRLVQEGMEIKDRLKKQVSTNQLNC